MTRRGSRSSCHSRFPSLLIFPPPRLPHSLSLLCLDFESTKFVHKSFYNCVKKISTAKGAGGGRHSWVFRGKRRRFEALSNLPATCTGGKKEQQRVGYPSSSHSLFLSLALTEHNFRPSLAEPSREANAGLAVKCGIKKR